MKKALAEKCAANAFFVRLVADEKNALQGEADAIAVTFAETKTAPVPAGTEVCHARKRLKIKACGISCASCDGVTE